MSKKKKDRSNVTITSCKNCSHKKVCKYKDDFKKEKSLYKKELVDTKKSKLSTVEIRCKHYDSNSCCGFGGFGSDDDDLFS